VRLVPWDHSFLCLEQDLKRPVKDPNLALRGFFSGSDPSYADTLDEDGRPLFQRAHSVLGPLKPDEMYGFEPAIVVGGKVDINSIRIFNIRDHLGLLRQLAPPNFPMGNLNIDKLL